MKSIIATSVALSAIFATHIYAFSCTNDHTNFRCVEYVRNYDGDTVTFNIPNMHPIIGKNIKIRLNGIDTPEIRTKDECEKKVALLAKDFVANLLSQARVINLNNIKRGKYFRIIADIYVDGEHLNQLLLDNNLAVEYDGSAKKKVNWCNYYSQQ